MWFCSPPGFCPFPHMLHQLNSTLPTPLNPAVFYAPYRLPRPSADFTYRPPCPTRPARPRQTGCQAPQKAKPTAPPALCAGHAKEAPASFCGHMLRPQHTCTFG